jgi:group II intron reverse transcriptase/maturase
LVISTTLGVIAPYGKPYGNGRDKTKGKAVTGMKTDKLLERILDADNLNQAFKRVKSNKGASGVDGMKTSKLKEHLSEKGEVIKAQIRTRKYKPSPVRRVEIPKTDGGIRNLGVPTVTDRFIQQAIAQVLTPIYERQFHENSYGFRPNRCAQMAIIKALEIMNDGYTWIVDIDLEKFFDTVNHDKLMQLISKTIQDGDVISLIRKYLVSGVMIDDEYKESIIGTPQGGNLSPLLSNIMLNELDKELDERGLNFVRYADDCAPRRRVQVA